LTWPCRPANGRGCSSIRSGFVEWAPIAQLPLYAGHAHGRITICESDKPETLVEAITAYIAHRLIEREQALAVDYASGGLAQRAQPGRRMARDERARRDGRGRAQTPPYADVSFSRRTLGVREPFLSARPVRNVTYRRFIGN